LGAEWEFEGEKWNSSSCHFFSSQVTSTSSDIFTLTCVFGGNTP